MTSISRALLSFSLAMSLISATAAGTFSFGTAVNPDGDSFMVDDHGFIVNGKHCIPVMGEIHYARVPAKDWRREIRKMKAGGITVVSTYTFWIHHEPSEGKWDWSGNSDLHSFLQICKEEHMPVVLRIGPFCHGEVLQGGFPTWLVSKAQHNPKLFKLRSEAPGFIAATQRFYSNVFAQASDMLWKHGGPVVGVQIENECRGPWSYYMRLKDMAVAIGFDVPFYTRTGWPKLNGKETFGSLLPLYGDYADGFWDRKLSDMPGDYAKAFVMKDGRMSSVIATETFSATELKESGVADPASAYPYLTCELGGGMMPAYHRRINMSGNEAFPLAICKLGSGSNLPGYYMYHGGANPLADSSACSETLGETQASAVTNYNDMPYVSYDFQAPLGEMGQPLQNAFNQTRWLHQFLADWGGELALMGVDSLTEHYARRGYFEFYNDYVRIINEGGTAYVRPVGMPFHGHKVTADAQPFCKVGQTLYFIPIKGKRPRVVVDGKTYTLKQDREKRIGDITVMLISEGRAAKAFKIDDALLFATHEGGILYKADEGIVEEYWQNGASVLDACSLVKDADAPRTVAKGRQNVAAMPANADFDGAAVWQVALDDSLFSADSFLNVSYAGDCARFYADGKLVEDNFWNGKSMLIRLDGLKGKRLELRILPLAKDAPVYLQSAQRAELDAANGALLKLKNITVLHRKSLSFQTK